MPKPHSLTMSIIVLARMMSANEIRRQRRLGLNIINQEVIEGLIERRKQVEAEQTQVIRKLVGAVFLSFIAWQGGNITIPGTGTSIAEIPAFLEISLVSAALLLMWLPYLFLNIQLYDGLIQSIVQSLTTRSAIDEDIVVASRLPVQLYIKYARTDVVIGRSNGYTLSTVGKVYNIFLIALPIFVFMSIFVCLFVSVLAIAHLGLQDSYVGWAIYSLCWLAAFVGVYAISANFASFKYEVDFTKLESFDDPMVPGMPQPDRADTA